MQASAVEIQLAVFLYIFRELQTVTGRATARNHLGICKLNNLVFIFVGKGFTLLAADMSAARSVLIFKKDEDKIVELANTQMIACAGPTGDRLQFSEYIQKNCQLNFYRTGLHRSCHATAHFIRNELARGLRRNPRQVNLLLGGYDAKEGGEGAALYFMDYLAALHKLNYACHGYCSKFCGSLLDSHWKAGMNLDEAIKLLQMCIKELKVRFLINCPNFIVKVADAKGTREIDIGASPKVE
jgi:20S proteasome subunit beta 4